MLIGPSPNRALLAQFVRASLDLNAAETFLAEAHPHMVRFAHQLRDLDDVEAFLAEFRLGRNKNLFAGVAAAVAATVRNITTRIIPRAPGEMLPTFEPMPLTPGQVQQFIRIAREIHHHPVVMAQLVPRLIAEVESLRTPAEVHRYVTQDRKDIREIDAYREVLAVLGVSLARMARGVRTKEQIDDYQTVVSSIRWRSEPLIALKPSIEAYLTGIDSLDEIGTLLADWCLHLPTENDGFDPIREAFLGRLGMLSMHVSTEQDFETFTKHLVDASGKSRSDFVLVMGKLSREGGSPEARKAAKAVLDILIPGRETLAQEDIPAWLLAVTDAADAAPADNSVRAREIGHYLAQVAKADLAAFEKAYPKLMEKHDKAILTFTFPALLGERLTHADLQAQLDLKRSLAKPAAPVDPQVLLSRRGEIEWPLRGVIRYLIHAFRSGEPLNGETMQYAARVCHEFDPRASLTTYQKSWLKKNAKRLVLETRNVERAFEVLDSLGLRQKLMDTGEVNQPESYAWWLSRKPLPSQAGGPQVRVMGRTAGELGIRLVTHFTKNGRYYENIVRSPDGKPNVLISENRPGMHAAYGDGFYTPVGTGAAWGDIGIPIHFLVDPSAREFIDFTHLGNWKGGQLVWHTSNKLRVLSLSPDQMFQLLKRDPLEKTAKPGSWECVKRLWRLIDP